MTIVDALLSAAGREVGEYVFYLDDDVVKLSSAELASQAERQARHLVALGLQPGDVVGILGPNRPQWVVSAFAVWLAGGVVAPVQIPLRVRDPQAFREQLGRFVETASCNCVLADPAMLGLLPEGVGVAWGADGGRSAARVPTIESESPAVIQFSSGSTASPKGTLLTHRAVMAQMDILRGGCHRDDGERRSILSWAPFFHDLGLFYSIVQVAAWGLVSHHLPTDRFARDPAEWLRLVETTRCTMTVGPSSAFGSAIKAANRRGETPDLSSLEVCHFAAEGVDPSVAVRLTEADFRLRPEALGSTYGLAETVLATSYSRIGSGLRIDSISLGELTREGVAVPAHDSHRRQMVSCGPPHMEVRIDGRGGELPERHIGEVQVRGPSMMSCYVGTDAPDPFVDGWLRTGDLGYLADGELYVTGRAKDLMISVGQNYYPEDFEWAASRAEGVKPGRCVAFSVPGREEIAVLVEARDGFSSPSFEGDVADTIADTVGVRPRVIALQPGTVEKTTSGKLRRAAMREAYAKGSLKALTA